MTVRLLRSMRRFAFRLIATTSTCLPRGIASSLHISSLSWKNQTHLQNGRYRSGRCVMFIKGLRFRFEIAMGWNLERTLQWAESSNIHRVSYTPLVNTHISRYCDLFPGTTVYGNKSVSNKPCGMKPKLYRRENPLRLCAPVYPWTSDLIDLRRGNNNNCVYSQY